MPDAYDTLAARVEEGVHRRQSAWSLQILRYEQLPADSKVIGPPPWLRFIASRGRPDRRTTIGPFTVLLKQQSVEELVREITTLLDRVWQLQGAERAKTARHGQTDKATKRRQRAS